MSIAEIERSAADLKSNEALRAEVEKIIQPGMSQEAPLGRVVSLAATNGYAFTTDEAN